MAETSRQYYCYWESEQKCDENFNLMVIVLIHKRLYLEEWQACPVQSLNDVLSVTFAYLKGCTKINDCRNVFSF